jgi:hypothetical protein
LTTHALGVGGLRDEGGGSDHDGRDCEAVENSHLKLLCTGGLFLKCNCSRLQLVPGACLSSIVRCELFCSDFGRTKAWANNSRYAVATRSIFNSTCSTGPCPGVRGLAPKHVGRKEMQVLQC